MLVQRFEPQGRRFTIIIFLRRRKKKKKRIHVFAVAKTNIHLCTCPYT